MELRQLRSLVALAESLNFRKAAKKVGISQPSLTVQIQKLEKEVGVALVYRPKIKRRKVSMTAEGWWLVTRAEIILFLTKMAIRRVQKLKRAA